MAFFRSFLAVDMFCLCRNHCKPIQQGSRRTYHRCHIFCHSVSFFYNWNDDTSPTAERTQVCYYLTTATVISDGIRSYSGKNTSFPEFEFQVNGTTYKVKSLRRCSFRFIQERKKVALYYSPENLRIFYVPIMQKHDNHCSILFCGIGIIFPLIGLFAPQIRTLFSFLP